MKKKCKNCGNEFVEDIKFCTTCGNILEEVKETPKPQVEQTGTPTQTTTVSHAQPKPVDKILIPIVIIAVILSIVAIALPLVLGDGALSSGSVGTTELADNSVTSVKIADGTIVDDDISDVGISKIAALAIDMNHLSSVVADAITGAGDTANDSITSVKIKDYAVDSIDIKNNSITAGKIPADAVGSSEIAAGAVGASEIASEAVDTGDIADDAVTFDKMDMKIKCGLETSAINGTKVTHELGGAPTSVTLTPRYDGANFVIVANVISVSSTEFTVGLWTITFATPPVITEVTSGVDVYWVAMR